MPTIEDAHVLLKLMQQWNSPHMLEARDWLFQDLVRQGIHDLEDFRRHAPEGSHEERHAVNIASAFELAGVLVKHGLLDEDLFFDAQMVNPSWTALEEWIRADRRRLDTPALYENFEWLVNREKQWNATHEVDTSGGARRAPPPVH